jgi:hypothetical protein
MADIFLGYIDNFSHKDNCYRCNFCQQLLTCSPPARNTSTPPIGWWNCLPCKAEFFTEDSKLVAIVFVNLKLIISEPNTVLNSWYEIIVNLELRNTAVEHIINSGKDGNVSYKHKLVLDLNMVVPGINPQNVLDKLNTLITFS